MDGPYLLPNEVVMMQFCLDYDNKQLILKISAVLSKVVQLRAVLYSRVESIAMKQVQIVKLRSRPRCTVQVDVKISSVFLLIWHNLSVITELGNTKSQRSNNKL